MLFWPQKWYSVIKASVVEVTSESLLCVKEKPTWSKQSSSHYHSLWMSTPENMNVLGVQDKDKNLSLSEVCCTSLNVCRPRNVCPVSNRSLSTSKFHFFPVTVSSVELLTFNIHWFCWCLLWFEVYPLGFFHTLTQTVFSLTLSCRPDTSCCFFYLILSLWSNENKHRNSIVLMACQRISCLQGSHALFVVVQFTQARWATLKKNLSWGL